MKVRAVFTLETVDQIAAVVEFARTMQIPMEMGAIGDLPRDQKVSINDPAGVKDTATQQKLWSHACRMLKNSSMMRKEFVRALAKRSRVSVKTVGITVKAWIGTGALKVSV